MESGPAQLTLGTILLRLLAVLGLVMANAFFVAAEFSLVSARRSRIDALAAQGDRAAQLVQHTLVNLNYYISAAQLGITIASLALGWVGEAAMASLMDRLWTLLGGSIPPAAVHAAASIAAAFFVLTFLHIVLGEQGPKTFALLNPEQISRWIVRPLRLFATATKPLTWLLNTASNGLLRLFHVKAMNEGSRVHSPEELRMLVLQTHEHGLLDETESNMVAGVFDFAQKKARDVMLPRTEIVALPVEATEADVRKLLRSEGYSRYPVYRETLDDVVGVFLAKDFWLHEDTRPFSLQALLRAAHYVPDTRAADRVLDDLRKTRAHMAIVLDEYGGTAGLVTMEDLVEEVIGDIADEYDPAIREALVTDGVLELAGSLSLIDVRSDYNVAIPEGGWTTLGGYVFSRIGRLPKMGDRVPFPGGELEVVAMDGRRVAAVRVHRAPVADASPA